MYKTSIIKTRHLYIGSITIFILGVLLGITLVLANFRTVMHLLRPPHHEMAEILARDINKRLSDSFSIPESSQKKIRDIIISAQPEFDRIFGSVHQKLEDLHQEIINKISLEIPDLKDREEFLNNTAKYFPPGPPPPAPPAENPHD